HASASEGMGPLLAAVASQLDGERLTRSGHTDQEQERVGELIGDLLLRANRSAVSRLADAAFGLRLNQLADGLPDMLRSILLSVPHFPGNRYHAHDRRSARAFAAQLGFAEPEPERLRVAILTDTVDDVNGVALGLRRLAASARSAEYDLR